MRVTITWSPHLLGTARFILHAPVTRGLRVRARLGRQIRAGRRHPPSTGAFLEGRQTADARREQQKVCDADALVLQFPLWWYGMPAILKGWFDRAFASGFAFGKDAAAGRWLRFEQGPFVGKRTFILLTLGDRPAAIGPRGISGELHELLFGLLHGTLAYTGMSVLWPMAVPGADFTDAWELLDHVRPGESGLSLHWTDEHSAAGCHRS